MAERIDADTPPIARPPGTATSVVDLLPEPAAWDAFVVRSDPGSYLQTTAWAEVKAPNGWTPLRFSGTTLPRPALDVPATATATGTAAATATSTASTTMAADGPAPATATGGVASAASQAAGVEREPASERLRRSAVAIGVPGDEFAEPALPPDEPVEEDDAGLGEETAFGAQLLLRRPRLFPWAFAYAPRGPIFERWNASTLEAFTAGLRGAVASAPMRVSHVRIEPEIELDGPADADGTFRHALRRCEWRPATAIQPPRTRKIDLRADEAALWGDLRKKWRQYVNKARRADVTVVEASADRLPEFYAIYQETAKRAGFIIRTYDSYLGVWNAFARLGMARLLIAQTSAGEGLATLFLLRVGDRVIEPYGGMTAAGAESRANYLLKWEAIRTSREQGAVSYDMWGLSHEGIEQFKSGFGGREIRYVGAWDLVLDPAGRLAFDGAQTMQDRVGRLRHGIHGRRPHHEGPENAE